MEGEKKKNGTYFFVVVVLVSSLWQFVTEPLNTPTN